MALQKTITLIDNFGEVVTFESAYVKVLRVVGSKSEVEIIYGIARNNTGDVLQINSVRFIPDMDGENFIRQAYLHLKTLPEFANAVDC
jgi:hypothetical protein